MFLVSVEGEGVVHPAFTQAFGQSKCWEEKAVSLVLL